MLPVQNTLKEGVSLPLLFNFGGLQLNGAHQLVFINAIHLLSENNTIKCIEALSVAS
jgi:hypothetical protein